jgi:protein SCO1
MKRRWWHALAVGVLVSWGAQAGPVEGIARRPQQQFVAPLPGTYSLQVIQATPNGNVLDVEGKVHKLADYTTGKVTLLGFIYTYCVDPIGCPLAYQAFVDVRKRLMTNPEAARQVRFVSMSFDPTNDTPMAMRHYAGNLADAQNSLRWHFLTTRSVAELKPVIDHFGQDVSVQLDDTGRPTRLFNHLLKVFLIDAHGRVREIYTTAFLLPDVIYNDIQTLLRER